MQNASPNILFVDDDHDSRELMSMMLSCESIDYKMTLASTPLEALDLIAEKPFDLFIVDYKLPEMTGVELCRRIRHTDKQTPILFFTGMSGVADQDVAFAAGASSYLVKPNDLDKFTDTVRHLLSRKQETIQTDLQSARSA